MSLSNKEQEENNSDKGAMSYPEGDYKRFEPKEVCVSKTCGDHTDHHRGEGRCEGTLSQRREQPDVIVESSEPQEKTGPYCAVCGHPLNPATAGYRCTNINCGIPAPVESQEEKMSHWQYQQFAEAAITQLKDKNESLESDNKLLREEIERLKSDIDALSKGVLDNVKKHLHH